MYKKGAMELSIGTIVIIVLALSMLILGLVLVRTIMCGAVGLTGDLNSRVKGEVSKLFEATGGEVQCVGNTGEAVAMTPGKTNIIWCSIRASKLDRYKIEVTGIEPASRGVITSSELNSWIAGTDEWEGDVSPGDEDPKKILRLDVPKTAPETGIVVNLRITKPADPSFVSTQNLDFTISRQGLIKAAVC